MSEANDKADEGQAPPSLHEPQALRKGDVCGDYVIDELLAIGGMAQIYRAHHELMRRVVAIKVLSERYRTRPDIRTRTISEARALAEIDHPNVVRIFHAGEHPTFGPYMVMELLEGRNLRQIMRRGGAMPVKQALTYGIEIAEATHALHRLGIIHRDLKPDNIFMTREPRTLKLLDLGAAKIEKYGNRTTGNFQTIGTASYMSPEHLDAKRITPASDVYSLGHVIYELIAGNHAFLVHDSAAPTPENFSRWQRMAVPDPINKVVPGVSEHTSRVLARALEKDPASRYENMRDFAMALQSAFREELETRASVPSVAPSDLEPSAVASPGKGRFGTDLLVPKLNVADLRKGAPAAVSRGTIRMSVVTPPSPVVQPAAVQHPVGSPPRAVAPNDSRRMLQATPSPVTVDDVPVRASSRLLFAVLGGLLVAVVTVVVIAVRAPAILRSHEAAPATQPTGGEEVTSPAANAGVSVAADTDEAPGPGPEASVASGGVASAAASDRPAVRARGGSTRPASPTPTVTGTKPIFE